MGGRKQRLRAKVPTQTLKKIRQFSHFFSETTLGISFMRVEEIEMISKVALTSTLLLNAVFQQCKVHLRDITQMAKREFFEYSGHPPPTGFWVPHGF